MTVLRRICSEFTKSAQFFLQQDWHGLLPTPSHSLSTKASKVKECLCPVSPVVPTSSDKITIVGAGQVGVACAISLLGQKISSDVCFIDIFKDKLHGETLDFLHGSSFIQSPRISAADDYSCAEGSRICIIAAGVRQSKGENRLALLQRNADVLKNVIENLVKYCPDTILLLVLNPVDVMTYVAWKLSSFPVSRVLGTGTHLDTARFRFLMAHRLGIAPSSCHAHLIGEHGESTVVVWSGVSVAGVRLRDLNPAFGEESDPEKWRDLQTEVVEAGALVHSLKNCTQWAIALSASNICKAIIANNGSVVCCTTSAKGYHGIKRDIFLSLPCVLSSAGVTSVIKQTLSPSELEAFQKSASKLEKAQDDVKF